MTNENAELDDNHNKSLLADYQGDTKKLQADINGNLKTASKIINDAGDINVQNPFPTDGDSIYAKDVWVEESITTDWVDEDSTGIDVVLIPFTNLHTRITNTTGDAVKTLLIHFNRTVSLDQVGLGCVGAGENFSNVKVIILGSGGVERDVLDDSANDTKYTSRNYQFGPELGNAIKLEFYTTDPICISNITVQKVTKTSSTLRALKPDGTVTDIDATAGGNLKVSVEELESGISSNLNSQLNVTPFHADGTEGVLITGIKKEVDKDGIDSSTNTLQNIEYEHHEIHSGSHYNYCDYTAEGLADAAVTNITIQTADTDVLIHLALEAYSATGAEIELFAGTTGVTLGTAITPRNNRLDSINTSGATILLNPTIVSDGTRAAGFLAGAGRSSGFATRSKENILARNTTYLARITSTAAQNRFSWCLEWYEHEDKN